MYILGLNAFHADSSACIFGDGELIAAIEEERFSRIKHWAGFPVEAIKFCLNEAGISIAEVDHITIGRDPNENITRKLLHIFNNKPDFSTILDRYKNSRSIGGIKRNLAESLNVLAEQISAQIHHLEHHRSHLASAFYPSPYGNAALLSIDGFGDFTSTMIGIGEKNSITVLDKVYFPHSLGVFYTAFTQFLGFNKYGDEYKIMGLAPYGNPKYVEQMKDILLFTVDGLFKLNTKYFRHQKTGVEMNWNGGEPFIGKLYSDNLMELFGQPRAENEITSLHVDIAASVQKITEELIFHIVNNLFRKTRLENLCIAGGVAQNSVANGKIYKRTPFKNIYIPPAGHDAGISIGSAMYLHHQKLKLPRMNPMYSAAMGSKFSNEDMEKILQQKNISYQRLSDEEINKKVADCIISGGVVGWFQGRAEFGPRALGHRSILADPRRADAKDLLNEKIKRRESFRPFAPSVLIEFVAEYFEREDYVPFMEKVFEVRKDKRNIIPAVTHVDGTGRLQTVDKDLEPKFYELISSFHQKTGVPVLLNTSFNENEPIVNSPEEALDCFLRTKMDMLILENCMVTR